MTRDCRTTRTRRAPDARAGSAHAALPLRPGTRVGTRRLEQGQDLGRGERTRVQAYLVDRAWKEGRGDSRIAAEAETRYVESSNFDSLKSCRRMGYAEFGSIHVVRISGRYRAFSSAGCRRLGFRVEPVADTA
jgi:hypothetical protein